MAQAVFEQLVQRTLAQRGVVGQAELLQRDAVGADHAAVLLEGDDAFVGRIHELRMPVETQQVIAMAFVQQQAVLDVLRADLGQREGMGLRLGRAAGDVQRCDQLAARVEDRRRGTGQLAILYQEMFLAVHDQRALLDQAGAHAVGALLALAPDRPFAQAAALGLRGEAGFADVVHDHAIAIGQHDPVVGVRHMPTQADHLDARDLQEWAELLAPHLQLAAFDDRGSPDLLRIECVALQAAAPRMPDQRRDLAMRDAAADHRLHQLGVSHAVRARQHVLLRSATRLCARSALRVLVFRTFAGRSPLRRAERLSLAEPLAYCRSRAEGSARSAPRGSPRPAKALRQAADMVSNNVSSRFKAPRLASTAARPAAPMRARRAGSPNRASVSCASAVPSATSTAAPEASNNSRAAWKLCMCGPNSTGRESAAGSSTLWPPTGTSEPPTKATSAAAR